MEGIKCVNLIEIGPVVIEIQGVENGDLVIPVNNTLVCPCRMSFLAADTRPCVLISLKWLPESYIYNRVGYTILRNTSKVCMYQYKCM